MNIGLIDADLLDKGTRHPNLVLMKISGYMKAQGNKCELLLSYNTLNAYDKIYLAKVFDYTKVPIDLNEYPQIEYGGTGFYYDKAPNLPDEIEHFMPDYSLYDTYVQNELNKGVKRSKLADYLDYSIGFTTRGCFRKCPFCVNRKYDHAFKHSPVNEFLDKSRKGIYLWDDNFLAYPNWSEILDTLESTGKHFQFKQGLDIRLMTEEKAQRLSNVKYKGDYIFAFDNLNDAPLIEQKLTLWRNHCSKSTKLYVFCGFKSQDINDIVTVFERIKILFKYQCLPYIMRYKDYANSPLRGIYITLARWCNQPSFVKKMSFREFCEANGGSSMRYLNDFINQYPEIAAKYIDIKFMNGGTQV